MAKAHSLEVSKMKASGMERNFPQRKLILFLRNSIQKLIDKQEHQHQQTPRHVDSVDCHGHTMQNHVLQKDKYATNVANKIILPKCALQKVRLNDKDNNHMLTE